MSLKSRGRDESLIICEMKQYIYTYYRSFLHWLVLLSLSQISSPHHGVPHDHSVHLRHELTYRSEKNFVWFICTDHDPAPKITSHGGACLPIFLILLVTWILTISDVSSMTRKRRIKVNKSQIKANKSRLKSDKLDTDGSGDVTEVSWAPLIQPETDQSRVRDRGSHTSQLPWTLSAQVSKGYLIFKSTEHIAILLSMRRV